MLTIIFNDDDHMIKEFLKKHTFVLGVNDKLLKNTFYKLIDYGFTPVEILEIANVYPLFLLRKVGNTLMNFKIFEKMKLSHRQVIQMCKINPFIFSVDYTRVFTAKVKLLLENRFTHELLGEMFYRYPWLVTKSVNSFKVKIKYLNRFYNLNMIDSPFAVTLLNYKYESFIKPRGDLMLKKEYNDWQKVMKLTDEKFCKEIGCTLQELNNLKTAESDKKEIDLARYKELKVITKDLWATYLDHPLL